MKWLPIKNKAQAFTNPPGSTRGLVKHTLYIMVALLALLFLIAVYALFHITGDINQQEQSRTRNLLLKALDNREETLKLHVRSYANWGEGYTHLHRRLDVSWAWQKQNFGSSMYRDYGYEGAFVIDPQGRTRYSVINGKLQFQPLAAWLTDDSFARLVAELRNPRSVSASLRVIIRGQPAIVTATAIDTGGDAAITRMPGPPSLLVFVDILTSDKLQRLGNEYQIIDLRLSATKDKPLSSALTLPLLNGSAVLQWTCASPGHTLLRLILPLLLFVMLLAVALTALLLRHAMHKARLRDENILLLEQSRQALAASERRFRDVVEATTDWIWEADEQLCFTWLSDRFPCITGYSADAWLGRRVTELIQSDGVSLASWFQLSGHTSHRSLTHCRYFSVQGDARYCNLTAKSFLTADGRLMFRGTATDVTLEVEAQARVQYLSRHDELTGLANRVRMKEFLEGKLQALPGRKQPLAMISLDLDKFKPVNDLFGHHIGDEILNQVSDRLRECLRSTDLATRHGGDEFILIIPDIERKADIDALCQRIVQTIGRPFYVQDHEIYIGVSMGVALAPENALDASDLLRFSDIALYKAKNNGRNCWAYYSAEMTAQIVQRREMESSLREAIKGEQFQLVYQPRYDIRAARVVAAEALLRWHHPQLGVLMPDRFIPLAEDSGLIIQITDWVLKTACRDAQQELNGLAVSVNISAVEFQTSGLVDRVQEALQVSQLDPARLELEITENATLGNPDDNIGIMYDLKNLGVRILIDDFGTGYSSLNYLRSFPLDGIKLDKSFVAAMSGSENANSVVENMIGLGKAFSLNITAEGVETQEQLTQLKKYQCDATQGYFISRPMPLPELKRQLAMPLPG